MNKVDRSLHVPAVDPDAFYERVCKADSRPVPEVLRESHPFPGGQVTVPVERYTSREYHNLEVERLWKKCWQMACREEEIPQIGDTHVYEIASMKFIIVRSSPTKIKAYANSCLHRGRQLVDCDGRYGELRCPFHGFGWDLEGRLAKIPGAWDFEIDPETWRLPEAQVGTWGGFVFINPDLKAAPLSDFLGDIDKHYARYPLQDRYISGHAAKVVPTNWKAAQEAFMEAFHVQGTHPQLLPQSANTDYKYDCYGNYARAIGVNFIPSIWASENPNEQQMMDAAMDVRLDEKPTVIVPDEKTARLQTAHLARQAVSQFIGDAADKMSDTEMVDSFFMNIFPNIHPWAAYSRITFRFRPYKDDPDRSIQDVYILSPFKGERPPAAKVRWLSDDEDWTKAPEIGGYLARIINQDLFNMQPGQDGMKSSVRGYLTFSRYQESKIRHFHSLMDKWVDQSGPSERPSGISNTAGR